MQNNICGLSASTLIGKLACNKISSSDIYDALLNQLKLTDVRINAYVRRAESHAVNCSQASNTILKGLPITVKDNICTEGITTECCSRILNGFVPPYDATVITRLKAAGATIFPYKANMDEFAFGSSTENSCFGPTRNPWNLACVAGGSSGGSAAAVASDQAIVALGSDTGGSIRQPASFCGVVGLKPTYGRVSRYGLIAFASSLDQIGPLTKNVSDSALVLSLIAGHDTLDATTVPHHVPDFTKALVKNVRGITVGIPKEYFIEGIDPEIVASVKQAVKTLQDLGAAIKDVSLPHTQYAIPVYYIIATAEASSNLSRFDGVQYGYRYSDSKSLSLSEMYIKTRGMGFGSEAKRRIILGTFALSHGYYDAYYLRAVKVRARIAEDFSAVFKECDCIITPTSPSAAFKIGERNNDPLKMYLSDVFTISANLAGLPAISIPCGLTAGGLPIGLQVLAKPFDEETLFRVAYTYEQESPWHTKKPRLELPA